MKYVGFDIGGTKCAVSIAEVLNGEITIEKREEIPTEHNISAYEMIGKLIGLAENMAGTSGRKFGLLYPYVGISCGGPLSEKLGIVQSPPNLPGWDDIHITEFLEDQWGNRAYLINDANACALAEYRFGAGRGTQHMIFLTFGTGMGAGLVLNGELYSGASDLAGEVGHIRLTEDGPIGYGKAGSFEGYCSGGSIGRIGRKLAENLLLSGKKCSFCEDISKLDAVSAKTIAQAAEAGHEDALSVYRMSGEKLGAALAILIDVLNPERIVIGSVFARSGKLMRDAMEEVLQRECLPGALDACEVAPAVLGDAIGDYAAISAALLCEERKK